MAYLGLLHIRFSTPARRLQPKAARPIKPIKANTMLPGSGTTNHEPVPGTPAWLNFTSTWLASRSAWPGASKLPTAAYAMSKVIFLYGDVYPATPLVNPLVKGRNWLKMKSN